MYDDRTPYLNLGIPNLLNPLSYDVQRLREALTLVDQYLSGEEQSRGLALGDATLDASGKVPLSQLPDTVSTGVMLDYALKTLPSASWRFCNGAALLTTDTAAAALRAALIADGSLFGADTNGNPLLPDYRGRVGAGAEDMGVGTSSRVTTIAATIGSSGGAETHTLTTAQLPSHNHAVTDVGHSHGLTDPGHNHAVSDPGHAHSVYDAGHSHAVIGSSGTSYFSDYTLSGISGNSNNVNGYTNAVVTGVSIYTATTGISVTAKVTGITMASAATGITIQNNGSGAAHNNIQPTLFANKIIKL